MVEFVHLEFGTHGFLMNHVFLPTDQAETNICWIIYQDATFEICLSLFGWKENILDKMHIVHWTHCALDKRSAQCTRWMWWQILCWANCALDKRQCTSCGWFQYNDGWGLGVGVAQRNNRLFQKANSDLIQFSMRTKMEHWKLDEIAWAWEYPTILTVHWK